MAVYDRRAHHAITAVLHLELSNSKGRYRRYMALVASLQADAADLDVNLTARDVDLALYTLGAGAISRPDHKAGEDRQG